MDDLRPRARAPLRKLYAAVYAGAAVLGAALVAEPSRRFVVGLGLRHPVLPERVPADALVLLLAALLAGMALRFALAFSSGGRPRPREHAAFLLLIGAAAAARALSGAPAPPPDPAPALAAGLSTLASALDGTWSAGAYAADPVALQGALRGLRPPGFVFRGRPLPLRVRVLVAPAAPRDASGAVPPPALPTPLPGDPPGTLYVSLASDSSRAVLTAVTLGPDGETELLRRSAGPVAIRASGGTHGDLFGDALLPAYPGARPASSP